MIINKPTTKDGGTYTCTATNNIGSQQVKHKVEFTPISTPQSRRDSGMPSETASESGKGKGDAAGAGAESGAENSATQTGKGRRPPAGTPRKAEAPVVEYTSRRPAAPTMEELQKAARSKLSFVTHLTNRVFAEGSKVKLSCVIQGPGKENIYSYFCSLQAVHLLNLVHITQIQKKIYLICPDCKFTKKTLFCVIETKFSNKNISI